jgi:hypothetical protein
MWNVEGGVHTHTVKLTSHAGMAARSWASNSAESATETSMTEFGKIETK